MAKAIKIVRRSMQAFSQNHHSLALVLTFLIFPASTVTLLSQSANVAASVIFRTVSHRLRLLFEAAGFPSSEFFSLLNYKLSLTVFLFVSTLPSTLSFLILAKASIFRILHGHHLSCTSSLHAFTSLLLVYHPSLLRTYFLNCLVILSANAAVVSALFLAFNAANMLHLSSSASTLVLSAAGVILYSLVIANAAAISSVAVVVSYADNSGGCLAVLKALVLVKGKMGTAITLALPANIGLAAVEAFFQYRVIRPYRRSGAVHWSMLPEVFCITCMHSILLVLDTIITCTFVMNCHRAQRSSWSEFDHLLYKDSEGDKSVQV